MKEFTFKTFLELGTTISVPNYQRAYSWGKKQWNDFVNDLAKPANSQDYYFGHFIIEKNLSYNLEIIDGQQRVTTFIIFLIACKKYSDIKLYENIISKFKTVTYDNHILEALFKGATEESLLSLAITKSSHNIINAYKLFIEEFESKKRLQIENIDNYIEFILQADASYHLTTSKNVAVKMFEMHNSRGVPLTTIEKVKAKLMAVVYNQSQLNDANSNVTQIQENFAKIFELEEKLLQCSFRGQLKLDELLLSHLRVVDDGIIKTKGCKDLGNKFHSPPRNVNREVAILEYIDNSISENSNPIEYCKNVAREFCDSVEIMCMKVIEADEICPIVGDCLILERDLSTEFYLLLFRKEENCSKREIFSKWEKFLFIRDFHEKYYRKWYKDNFQRLYCQLVENEIFDNYPADFKVENLLDHALEKGFRPEDMDEGSLKITVMNYLSSEKAKNEILTNAFHWQKSKMVYLLYKFELSIDEKVLIDLRETIKDSISIEHILPQGWEWEWINADVKNLSDENKEFEKRIYNTINGIGNLIILTNSENSSQSNNHPKNKTYELQDFGSYKKHKEKQTEWGNHENWVELINIRGEDIYEFMISYFDLQSI